MDYTTLSLGKSYPQEAHKSNNMVPTTQSYRVVPSLQFSDNRPLRWKENKFGCQEVTFAPGPEKPEHMKKWFYSFRRPHLNFGSVSVTSSDARNPLRYVHTDF